MLDFKMKYKIQKGLIVQKLDNKITIFDGDKSLLYTFNETATYVFNRLKKGLGEKDIIKTMIKRYKIDENRVEKDVKEIIDDLLKKKVVLKV